MMRADTLLVEEAREILLRAAKGDGCIYCTRTSRMVGNHIKVGGAELIPTAANERVVVSWLGALEDLLGYGYIRRIRRTSAASNRSEFTVTPDGYDAVDELVGCSR